jgi:hypothetical protein
MLYFVFLSLIYIIEFFPGYSTIMAHTLYRTYLVSLAFSAATFNEKDVGLNERQFILKLYGRSKPQSSQHIVSDVTGAQKIDTKHARQSSMAQSMVSSSRSHHSIAHSIASSSSSTRSYQSATTASQHKTSSVHHAYRPSIPARVRLAAQRKRAAAKQSEAEAAAMFDGFGNNGSYFE